MATTKHHNQENMTIVFVYGTLMQGEGNHGLLARGGAAYIGKAITEPAFTMIDLGSFPAIVDEGTTAIRGELYIVDKATLRALDRLEGHPSFYKRTTIRFPDGSYAACYVMPDEIIDTIPIIKSGDWRDAA